MITPSVVISLARAVVALALTMAAIGCACENEIVGEFSSPNGQRRVVAFQRGCGATTATAVHAMMAPSSVEKGTLPIGTGNLLIVETDRRVDVKWLDDSTVEFTYPQHESEPTRTSFTDNLAASVRAKADRAAS